jgi:tetratricopeptide (TPR) repeat protein
MSSSQTQPIPKMPPERTLRVAVTLLILVAVVQLVAVGIALVPRIDFEKWGRSLAPHPAAPAVASTLPAEGSDDNSNKANELLAEAQKFREAGNFQGALEAVIEADRLVPNKPGILSAMADVYDRLGKSAELVSVCKRIVALPPSTVPEEAQARAAAQQVLAQVGGREAAPVAAKESSGTRDDVGIPIGSVMGIVDVKLTDGGPGQKNLSVSTKGASGQKVDPMKFQATVDFYEQDDHSQIVHNDSPRPNEWLSGPAIDWANADPEIFQVKYRLPLEDRGDLPPLQYYGYVVAIYYNGELQDQRADPPSLLNDHAPPLHKDIPAE